MAFVAASLALGVCMGVDFSDVAGGPDLLRILKSMDPSSIPEDVRAESLSGIAEHERAKPGDWIAVWGGKFIYSPFDLGIINHHVSSCTFVTPRILTRSD